MPKVSKKERNFIEPLRFTRPDSGWRPTLPPPLQDGEPIGFDFEYKPSDIPMKSSPIGFSAYRPATGEGWYVPFAHEPGGNLPKEEAIRWIRTECRGRDLYGLNIKAEMHMVRNLGIEPDELGMRPHDVAFPAALLDENRYSGFSLESLAKEYLPEGERKLHPCGVDADKFYLALPGEIADRAVSDAKLAWRIHEVTRPDVMREGLDRVVALEDRVILPVVEMERNGFLMDRPKLERWVAQIRNRIEEKFNFIYKETGVPLSPNKSNSMMSLFKALGLSKPKIFNEFSKQWEESFANEALKSVAYIDGKQDKGIANAVVAAAIDLKKLASIQSKYTDKYLNAIDEDNVLHYALHQLRSVKEFGLDDDSDFGTVSGRFSCGGGEYNVNAQQVMKCEKQIEEMGSDFIIRELMIAALGMMMGASDASQIEFRLFSHYASLLGYNSTADAYRHNPHEDFHLLVTILMNPTVTAEEKLKALRKHMKHNNFGVLYGMGRAKLARRLGLPCSCDLDWNETVWDERFGREAKVRYFGQNKFHDEHCKARLANDIMDEYDHKFPEARILLKACSDRARNVGFVKTLLGRRTRFPNGQRLHKALNGIIQGSAADYFKIKLVELYENRKTLQIVLRCPVHDEFVYDIDPSQLVEGHNEKGKLIYSAPRVQELLDTQSLNLRVPLLWDSGFGHNWKEANGQ